jgi:hypothetical protein
MPLVSQALLPQSAIAANNELGLGVLFAKLQQGVQENEQILTVARMRADAEDVYGQKLGDIEGATSRIDGGFQRDDGASVKKVSEYRRAQHRAFGIDGSRHTKAFARR